MLNDTVIFVSAGLTEPKKDYNPLAKLNLYLNYGLLGLATILKNKGYSASLFHGDYRPPKELLSIIINRGLLPSRYPVMLSIPSC